MTYKNVLRHQPWLKLININNISVMLLTYTHGDIFIAYNTLNGEYELHSVKSFKLTGYSDNTIVDKDMLNSYLYTDFRCHEHRKFKNDLEDTRLLRENYYNKYEEDSSKRKTNNLKVLERIIGTKI